MDLGLHRQSTTGIHQQADAQAAQAIAAPVKLVPGDGLVGQAHAVACIGQAQHLHHQGSVGHGAGHGASGAAGVGRVDRDSAQAGLEAEDTAPARWQAQRAADVGAHMQRAIAGCRSSTGAGTAAARGLAQVPGVTRQGMEGGQARGQHAVVGHGGLAHQHSARLLESG